jgi:hypothetical protein
MTGRRALMGIPNGWGFFLDAKCFFDEIVFMRILCGFCNKEQKFVRIRLVEKFPNAFKTMKIRMHKLEKLSRQLQDKFSFHSEIP